MDCSGRRTLTDDFQSSNRFLTMMSLIMKFKSKMKFESKVYRSAIAHFSLLLFIAIVFFNHHNRANAVSTKPFYEGVHFSQIDMPKTVKPEVKVFYSLYCKPCALFHAPIRKLAATASIEFVDIPVNHGPLAKDIQEAIVAADQQGLKVPVVKNILTSIHNSQGNELNSRDDIEKILAGCGVNTQEFTQKCRDIRQQADKYDALVGQYAITSTPTIVVNGNRVLHLNKMRSIKQLRELIIYLAEV